LVPYYASETQGRVKTFKIQGSNDNLIWTDLYSGVAENQSYSSNPLIDTVNNSNAYKYYRIYCIDSYASGTSKMGISLLQLFGVDYTEREFAPSSTVKYIYDHGLELEPITTYATSEAGVTKYDNFIRAAVTATASSIGTAYASNIDVTNHSILRGVIADAYYCSNSSTNPANLGVHNTVPDAAGTSIVAQIVPTMGYAGLPNCVGVDISSLSGSYIIGLSVKNASSPKYIRRADIAEMWLE
jgi:hypothetical protein